ncbi:hypothetical protein L1D31_03495 [Vibrio sp. Isolate23]|uniref:hypothetical protein n=1 Tax=Vibrio sp. Isolate23 TaxID=2908533 RepID=UPI001EFE24EC|nr:hypothetical protein [Vibrio sp. Isolate23]MCG9681624.1 hypothetical protein [Vibrio sp. Isolate23]
MQSHNINDAHNEPQHREEELLERAIVQLRGLLKDLTVFQSHTQQWSMSIFELFSLELRNTVAASKKLIVIKLLFVALLPMFLISIAVGIGVMGYYFTLNLLVGYSAFIAAFSVILMLLILGSRYYKQFVGFEYTKEQLGRLCHAINEKTTAENSNEKS